MAPTARLRGFKVDSIEVNEGREAAARSTAPSLLGKARQTEHRTRYSRSHSGRAAHPGRPPPHTLCTWQMVAGRSNVSGAPLTVITESLGR